MDVTAKLVAVFQVEKQLRGLKSRLDAAERFLSEQNKDLAHLDAKSSTLLAQAKTLGVKAADHEGEMKRLDERLSQLREQMSGAQTNKEYQAFLLEMNNYKTDRDKLETAALEHMNKIDELKRQAGDAGTQRGERAKVQKVAATDRDTRAAEIQTRVTELEVQRKALAADVPAEALAMLQRLLTQRGEDAMAPVHVQDRKRHEYTCGACQMSLPVDAVSGLMSKGKITVCSSCQCLLFLDDEANTALLPPAERSANAKIRAKKTPASK